MGNDAKKFIWNGIDLEQLRQTMDDPADKAVSSLFNSESMGNLRELLTVMAKNDDFVSLKLPDEMHSFVQTELKFNFSQQDISYFKQTHEIWKRDGMQFIFILFFRALHGRKTGQRSRHYKTAGNSNRKKNFRNSSVCI